MFFRIRRWIRRNTKPIDAEVAWKWKTKLSIMYAFIGWNLFSYLVYTELSKKIDKENTDSSDYAKLLGINQAQVVKFVNTKKVEEYEINLTPDEIEDYHKKVEEQQQRERHKPSTGYWNRRWIDEEIANREVKNKTA